MLVNEKLDRVVSDVAILRNHIEGHTREIGNARERLAVLEAGHTEMRQSMAENTRMTAETERKVDVTNRKLDAMGSDLKAHVKATEEVIEDNKTNKAIKNRVQGFFKWVGYIGTAAAPVVTLAFLFWDRFQ